MDREHFERWHHGYVGVPATDREWTKADGDGDGLVTEEERLAYEACCKFMKPQGEIQVNLPALDGNEDDADDDEAQDGEGRSCTTAEKVDAVVAEFEANTLTAEQAKAVLRRSLYALGVRRVQSDGNAVGTMTTPVKTAILKELVAGTKEALKESSYKVSAALQLEQLKELPKPPCVDKHSDASECAAFAKAGECDQNEDWMKLHCAKTCGFCVDEAPFFEGGFVTHLQGKKAFKRFRKTDVHSVTMFWEPGCKYCAMAKPVFAEDAQKAQHQLSEVVFAAVDCSRNQATCVKQGISKFPTFKWHSDGAAWALGAGEGSNQDGGHGGKLDDSPADPLSRAIVFGPETHPADPRVLATAGFLQQLYDAELEAAMEF